MNRFFDRPVMKRIASSENGTITIVILVSSGRDREHHDHHADDHQRGREHHAQGLLQALRDVVDVVGDPAQQVAAGLAVDVPEREAVELVLDVAAELVHGPLHDAGEDVALEVLQHVRRDVHAGGGQQHLVQLGEVDAVPADAVDDDVGRVAEEAGAEHREGHRMTASTITATSRTRSGAEAVEEPPGRVGELVGALDRHAVAEATTGGPGLGDGGQRRRGARRGVALRGGALAVAVAVRAGAGAVAGRCRVVARPLAVMPRPRRSAAIRRSRSTWGRWRGARRGCRSPRRSPLRGRGSGRRR